MACDLVIRGYNKLSDDGTRPPDEEMKYSNRKGAIVGCLDAGTEVPSLHLSGKQIPPDWCVVRSDVTRAQVEPFMLPWYPEISFSRQSLDTATDAWSGTVTADVVRSGDGHGLTRAQVEAFLAQWNVENMVFSQGQVTGDFTIFGLATSRRFFSRDLTGLVFELRGYVEASGEHEIRLDYAAVFPNNDAAVFNLVSRFAEVRRQNNAQDTIDYAVWRGAPAHDPAPRSGLLGDNLFAAIKEDVEETLNRKMSTRRWLLAESKVDEIMNASPDPGFMVLSPAELQASLEDVTAS